MMCHSVWPVASTPAPRYPGCSAASLNRVTAQDENSFSRPGATRYFAVTVIGSLDTASPSPQPPPPRHVRNGVSERFNTRSTSYLTCALTPLPPPLPVLYATA